MTSRKLGRSAARHTVLQPAGWPPPHGYANGIKARGEMIFVGGMVGWNAEREFPEGLVAQARQALANIVTVVAEGGGMPEHIVRLTWYVRDMEAYLSTRQELGDAYRAVMGKHFPTMALLEVSRLVEPEALVEIEATAVLPG
jgi:enamine deaminase RidA (YjgF/YER057c/UK114 family)